MIARYPYLGIKNAATNNESPVEMPCGEDNACDKSSRNTRHRGSEAELYRRVAHIMDRPSPNVARLTLQQMAEFKRAWRYCRLGFSATRI